MRNLYTIHHKISRVIIRYAYSHDFELVSNICTNLTKHDVQDTKTNIYWYSILVLIIILTQNDVVIIAEQQCFNIAYWVWKSNNIINILTTICWNNIQLQFRCDSMFSLVV